MPWYKVTLANDDIFAGTHELLQDQFAGLFLVSGAPKDAGMFASAHVRTHVYYFSPGAATIAMSLINRYSGVECPAPARADVHRLVGGETSQEIPFAPDR